MERQFEEALKVLGIPADSDRERAGIAYRRLARMTHPDVSPDLAAVERFVTVTAAYRLVSTSSVHSRNSGRAAASSESTLLRPPSPRSYGPGNLATERATATSDPARSSRQGVEWAHLRAGSCAHPPIVAGPVMGQPARGDAGAGEA